MEFNINHYRRLKIKGILFFDFPACSCSHRVLFCIEYLFVICCELQSSITALFAAGDDVGEAIAMAANSVGLKEMPRYEVEELADCDWVLEVEVLSVILCLCPLPEASNFQSTFFVLPSFLNSLHVEGILTCIQYVIQAEIVRKGVNF